MRLPRSPNTSGVALRELAELQSADSDRFLHLFRTVPRKDRVGWEEKDGAG